MDARRSRSWILGHMRKINSRISFGVCLRPIGLRTLEISFQYNRKPADATGPPFRLTTISACFHPDQNLRAMTQNSLSIPQALALRASVSVPRVAGEEQGFQEAACVG